MGLELSYTYGQTPISEEEKEGLIIRTISTRGELDEFEQQNIENAMEWTLSQHFSPDRILSMGFILEVHKQMFDRTWVWAGTIRKSNKNIGVDKLQINPGLQMLIDDCKFWIENEKFSKDEIAVRYKHGLVKIHPFPNGNGRHSRLCADILVSHAFRKDVFTWGGSNLAEPGGMRKKYLEAIHAADNGDLEPLVKFARS